MKILVALIAGMTYLVTASPVPPQAGDICNGIIGNCYDNGCDGNPTTLVCLSGPYRGCPCGYNCNGVGPCNGNGCAGWNGRCTASYLGCACN